MVCLPRNSYFSFVIIITIRIIFQQEHHWIDVDIVLHRVHASCYQNTIQALIPFSSGGSAAAEVSWGPSILMHLSFRLDWFCLLVFSRAQQTLPRMPQRVAVCCKRHKTAKSGPMQDWAPLVDDNLNLKHLMRWGLQGRDSVTDIDRLLVLDVLEENGKWTE